MNILTWRKSILQEMSKQWVILGLKLGHRCQVLGLVFKPQVLGLGSWILGSRSLVLGPVHSVIITKCDRYYKVWQKIITKCDRYYKVWQEVITKCNRYYKVWQLLQSEAHLSVRYFLKIFIHCQVNYFITFFTKIETGFQRIQRNNRKILKEILKTTEVSCV